MLDPSPGHSAGGHSSNMVGKQTTRIWYLIPLVFSRHPHLQNADCRPGAHRAHGWLFESGGFFEKRCNGLSLFVSLSLFLFRYVCVYLFVQEGLHSLVSEPDIADMSNVERTTLNDVWIDDVTLHR